LNDPHSEPVYDSVLRAESESGMDRNGQSRTSFGHEGIFPGFCNKYFAVEDSIFPYFWMLKEQIANGGQVLAMHEIMPAKRNARTGLG